MLTKPANPPIDLTGSLPSPKPLSSLLQAERALVTPLGQHPLELTALQSIERNCDLLFYLKSHLCAGLFAPLYSNRVYKTHSAPAAEIVSTLKMPNFTAFLSMAYGEAVDVTDIQVNRLRRGEDLRGHSHGADAKFVVLHLSQNYQGGRYYDAVVPSAPRFHDIPPYSMVLSLGDVHHGVTAVTSPETRTTIVVFLESSRGRANTLR